MHTEHLVIKCHDVCHIFSKGSGKKHMCTFEMKMRVQLVSQDYSAEEREWWTWRASHLAGRRTLRDKCHSVGTSWRRAFGAKRQRHLAGLVSQSQNEGPPCRKAQSDWKISTPRKSSPSLPQPEKTWDGTRVIVTGCILDSRKDSNQKSHYNQSKGILSCGI